MSELKDHWEYENGPIVMRRKVYYKSDVDAVIAEKDRALEYAKALTLKDIETIKEKDKEIAELKAKLEDAKATAYAESVDAGMRERRLKRALWIARALALSRFDVDEYLRKYTHCDSRYWNDGLNTFNEACKLMQKAINTAEAICKAKAEEFGG